MEWGSSTRPLILGHRGASAAAPENTLAAFRLAKEQGADGIELDVQLSADGWPVVLHDFTLERTTNGQGRVSDAPLLYLKTLDAGQGEVLPTLAEVFEELGPDFLYNVELKSLSWRDAELVTAVATVIQSQNLTKQIVISSFNPFIIQQAKKWMPAGIKVAHLWHRAGGKFKHNVIKADADHPHYAKVDERYMAWAGQRPLPVHVWTVDEVTEAKMLAALGVQAIITNKPQLLKEALS